METRYIKIGYEEALSAKKELLSAEINVLSISKELGEYRALRKKEFTLKNKLRIAFGNLKTKTNLLLSTFPEEGLEVPKPRKDRKSKEKNKTLQEELSDIKKKLSQLN